MLVKADARRVRGDVDDLPAARLEHGPADLLAHQGTVPVRFTASVVSHICDVRSSAGATTTTPAQLTSTSTWPNSVRTEQTEFSADDGSATSHWNALAFSPDSAHGHGRCRCLRGRPARPSLRKRGLWRRDSRGAASSAGDLTLETEREVNALVFVYHAALLCPSPVPSSGPESLCGDTRSSSVHACCGTSRAARSIADRTSSAVRSPTTTAAVAG